MIGGVAPAVVAVLVVEVVVAATAKLVVVAAVCCSDSCCWRHRSWIWYVSCVLPSLLLQLGLEATSSRRTLPHFEGRTFDQVQRPRQVPSSLAVQLLHNRYRLLRVGIDRTSHHTGKWCLVASDQRVYVFLDEPSILHRRAFDIDP